MKLKEFKKKLNELEVKLLLENQLTDEEIDITYFDWVALDRKETNLQLHITQLNTLEEAITIF